ncbi:MAG: MBL fold metallo-hydrolase [Methylobacteriaceae bacterium]|nr:MBL fold metallo-hydrolase [Methylobacteriaceae bacterium]
MISRRAALGGAAALLGAATLGAARAAPVATLGARRIEVASDGGFSLPLGMLARDVAPEALLAELAAAGLSTERAATVLNVTLIRDGEELTLIDCGAGGNFMPGAGKLGEALDAAGVDRAKVKRVLFTHAHPDHLWGALDSFDEAAYPEASFHIAAAERDFWLSADVLSKLPEDRHAFAAGAQRILKALGDRVQTFRPGAEVAPGVVALDTAGHTPGHVAFAVSGGGASLVVLGDALTHPALSFRRPDWATGADQDPAQAVATRKKLLDRLATDRLPFIGYHLPTPGLGRAEAKDGAWRYLPGG